MNSFRAALAFLGLTTLSLAAFDPVAFNAAVDLYNQRKPLEAQQAFETLAVANPQNADIKFYLGRLALQRDDADAAVAYLQKAALLKPDDSRFHQRLGDAYGRAAQKAGMFSKLGLAAKCKAEYDKAVELDPSNIDARFSLMGYYQQAPGIAGGSMEKAHEQAEAIKQLDASRGRAALAGLYVTEKKYAEAFAEFEAVLKTKPNDYAALFQTGRIAALSGERLEQGLAALRQCLAQPTPEGQPPYAAVHWRIGNILEKQGDQPGARAAYEEALKADPKFAQASESLKKL